MALIFVTSNRHKFEEVSELAARHGIELEHRGTPYIEIQADNLEDVVRPSAQQACALLKQPCFVEDAGLFVQALRGFPGPYSNFVFRTLGNEGLLKLMAGETDRRAEFRSAVGYCEPGQRPEVFTGKVKGTIAPEARGMRGFGFDPIFLVENMDKTFGEMEISEKNKFSHRAQAIEAFFSWYEQREKA
ncbi:MAG: XTP/dITP diphosphatase [Candidatus Hodarchaeaceae archaeon]|nr:XTP/dITP diphosphatase [Candidatus Hodarchaeaceae archaeon]